LIRHASTIRRPAGIGVRPARVRLYAKLRSPLGRTY